MSDIVTPGVPQAAEWTTELIREGFQGGAARVWDYQGLLVTIKAEEFGSPEQAIAYERWIGSGVTCHYSNTAYPGPVAYSVGFQIRWRDGGTSDQVTFIRGSRRYTVSIYSSGEPAGSGLADNLARHVYRHTA